MSDSATGGYLAPTSSQALPDGLTLTQFIQSVLVGISGFAGNLVRPKWQQNPPGQPDVDVNWLAFAITNSTQDTNAYVALDGDDAYQFQRQQEIEVQCSMYGPSSLENTDLLRDGFQITQNLEALQIANMAFVNTSNAMHAPELVNERFFDRYEFSIFLRRQTQRVYPILSFASASGTIHATVNSEDYTLDWSV